MKFLYYYKSLLWATVILFLSTFPFKPETGAGFFDIPHLDKVVHFGLYLIFCFVFLYDLSVNTKKKTKYKIIMAFLISFVTGCLMELIQHFFIPGRWGSIYDVLANVAGGFAGIFCFYLISRRSRFRLGF